jgi:ABC-type transport system involved in cytochrome c biogenesis permease subunit
MMLDVVRQSGLWIRCGSARKAPSRSTRRSRKVRVAVDLALRARRERQQARGAGPAGPGRGRLRILPNSEALETLAYRFAILGFIFCTFTLSPG